jgi:hypothetical protein
MKNSLRYIIREQIEKLLEAEKEMSPEEKIKNIQDQAKASMELLDNIAKETKAQIKADEKALSLNTQAKSATPPTVSVSGETLINPKRKGLDGQLPADKNIIKARKDALKKIEDEKKKSQAETDALIKAQMINAKLQNPGDSKSSVLPSMDSLI